MPVHERSSESVEWYTPPWIFDAMGVRFDWDVASPGLGVTPWIPADGAMTPAFGEPGPPACAFPTGLIWMNPPWGRGVGQWVKRWAEHPDGVALLPARTETRWGQAAMRAAGLIVFPAKRVEFIRPDGSPGKAPPVGIMLLARGQRAQRALLNFHGKVDSLILTAAARDARADGCCEHCSADW